MTTFSSALHLNAHFEGQLLAPTKLPNKTEKRKGQKLELDAGGLESGWGDMDFGGPGEEGNTMVQAPTKVNRVAATFARSAKQVRLFSRAFTLP